MDHLESHLYPHALSPTSPNTHLIWVLFALVHRIGVLNDFHLVFSIALAIKPLRDQTHRTHTVLHRFTEKRSFLETHSSKLPFTSSRCEISASLVMAGSLYTNSCSSKSPNLEPYNPTLKYVPNILFPSCRTENMFYSVQI